MKPNKIFYFAATHWDREWYKTVDEYRFKLIPVMDKILNTLSTDPDFKIFTLDGQTSILDDYLTVRGESPYEDTLKTFIRDDRLLIGPWFTMPDEFLISSESLIQNLLYGHYLCEKYHAKTLKTGYVCDTFGHAANFPQILNGFDIKSALISRGTNDYQLDSLFRWSSPDGSEVLTFKAPEICGYGSFFFEVLSQYAPDYQKHLDEITDKAIQYVERELTRTSLPYVILMDGMDHETIHEFMPEILKRLEEHFNCPVVQKRLDDVFEEIYETVKNSKENTHTITSAMTGHVDESGAQERANHIIGELTAHCRDNIMHNKLIPHTLSSRYDLKIANDQCQNLLEHYAMPCSAIDEMNGNEYLDTYLRYAYSLLLQNHAHDSICGCSIDDVHKEMLTRFTKTKYTAAEYFFQYCAKEYFRSTDGVTKADVSSSDSSANCCTVKIFNPLPYEYKGAVEFDIDFDSTFGVQSLGYIKFEQRNSFLILDENGTELKYNLINATRGKSIKQFGGNKRPADTHRVALLAKLKPLGYTTFLIQPLDLPYRITERFSDTPASCENDFIRFEAAADGTVTITDKRTGYTYPKLHSFLDCAEMGDGWYHIRPISDRSISSLGCHVTIEKTFDGYAECKFLLRYEFALPSDKVKERQFTRRNDTYDTCIIRSEFTIARDSALVRVHTEIDNNIRDHRLQLHLPTNVEVDKYYVNQCNLIISRPTGLDHTHHLWKEQDITEYPFESMVYMRSEEAEPRGLLFLSKGGLHEVSCPGDKENSMDITLLRCFSKTVNTDGEPDGQLQGRQVFDYALLPISKETDNELVKIKDQYVCGYQEFTIPRGAYLTSESAFIFHSDACTYLTCMPSKQSDSSIIIRAVNNSAVASACSISFAKEIETACLCNYLERETERATVASNTVEVLVPPYKMINIKVSFKKNK